MSITRINEFQAQPGQGDALRDLMATFVEMIKGSDGCLSCQLLQKLGERETILVIEVWESTLE